MTRRFWNFLTILALIAGAGWIWLSRAPAGKTSGGAIPAPQRGFQAPEFELTGADGKTYRLSRLRGHPILINFWASWCTPCKAEMPAVERVYQKYRERGFLVLGVNSTLQDNQTNALAFADRLGLSFPILLDSNGSASQAYEVRALPTSFFVDANGVIQDVIIGGPMAEALLDIRVQQLVEGAP